MAIRNFCILAHIDHGKSTLADRLLELTGTIEKRKMREQVLDMHPLERERGITIKMQPVRMMWRPAHHAEVPNPKSQNSPPRRIPGLRPSEAKTFASDPNKSQITNSNDEADWKLSARRSFGAGGEIGNWKLSGSEYILNLIDTPGHVDFTYEVSRALACVEGAILLVDATQGVQAQTLANLNLAQKEGLVIVPAINKIDLPSANVEKIVEELAAVLDIPAGGVLKISGKTGEGVLELLGEVIRRVPPPARATEGLARALIFDSTFDSYQGAIAHIRVVEGNFARRDRFRCMATKAEAEVLEIGVFVPERLAVDSLGAGEIGYIATGIKEPELIKVGDTITLAKTPAHEALAGYREPNPMVYASVFPENQDDYDLLRESLKKLKMNDASLAFEPEELSAALGRGFRVGFLGMLHMEIVAERLRREYGLSLLFTNPSVAFRVTPLRGSSEFIFSAVKMPDQQHIRQIEEPWGRMEIITPASFLGALTTLINERAGLMTDTATLGGDRMLIRCEAPLREIIIDFYDRLKSVTQGFASMAYEVMGYRAADLIRLDILVAGERIQAFSEVVSRVKVEYIARERVHKLKDLLPRELFAVALQAAVEGRVIARETIPAMRKDVTGYLYGGDRTRKMKLWKKQQKGKKRLKERGTVEIPPDVFLKMLKK